MTATELQALFETQLAQGSKKLFYLRQDTADTMSVLRHDTETGSFDDLLLSLQGYTHHESVGESQWPRFIKETL